MSENINTNTDKVDSLKKELAGFVKQKDEVFADYLRLYGIIAYVTNQLNTLDPSWNKAPEQAQPKETKTSKK
jgi:hypothetical protein